MKEWMGMGLEGKHGRKNREMGHQHGKDFIIYRPLYHLLERLTRMDRCVLHGLRYDDRH